MTVSGRDDRPTTRSPIPRLPEARLRLRLQGREFVCGRERPLVRFGRASENDLVVDDDYTSRRHGEIVYRYGRFQVTDHSSNGTLLVRAEGRGLHIQGETVLLEGRGTLRCGNLNGAGIEFGVEITSDDGGTWSPQEISLDPVPVAANLFRCEGEYWTLAYYGTVLRLRDSRGLRYIARLMQHPGQEMHVLDMTAPDTPSAGASAPHTIDVLRAHGHVDTGSGSGAVLDAQARAEYKQRLAELRKEAEQAEEFNDLGRAEAAQAELEFLSEQLASAVGIGGRDREAGSNAERARVAVTLRIKSTIQKVKDCHPALGAYLSMTIKTGRFCSFAPDPKNLVVWVFE